MERPFLSYEVSFTNTLEFGEIHGDSEQVMFIKTSDLAGLPSIPSISAPLETTSRATEKAIWSSELVTNALADSLASVLRASWLLVT